MKKAVITVMILSAILSLFGCDYHKLNHNISLPKYISDECYLGKGFRDNTDFCKYFYDEDSIIKFETHKKFKKVMDSDIENIKSYFENFSDRVKDESYYNYDFDFQSQIKEGDYFYIIDDGITDPEGLYRSVNYDVYYVDMSKCILYFIHSNT